MRTLPLLLLAACSAAPPIRPLDDMRGLRYSDTTEIVVVRDPAQWEAFVARQATEPALRLRALAPDFDRECFVFACVMVTSGSTRVEFEARFEGDRLAVRARTRTPEGPARADIAYRHYAAVVGKAGLDAVLYVDGIREGADRPPQKN